MRCASRLPGREGQIARSLIERGQAAGHEIVSARPAASLDLAGQTPTIIGCDRMAAATRMRSSRPPPTPPSTKRGVASADLAFAVNERGAARHRASGADRWTCR